MFDPQLLLLDEPFSALDYFTKLKLESEFYQLIKENQKGAVLVTHDIEESIAMGDRVMIMTKGGLIKREFKTDKFEGARSPELIRGTLEFGELYRAIWAELQAVILA